MKESQLSLIRRSYRRWWQVPRYLADRPQHRQVTFLELFYDLVYVVIIAELTHSVAAHVDGRHLAQFAFLFFIVWWAWLNGTSYHEVHGNDDIRTRIFTFLQMFTVAAMAIFAHDAFGETAVGFAISYAAFQLILAYLWWRTGVYDEKHRPLSQPYAVAFLLNAVLFFASAFVSPGVRLVMWIIGVLIALLLPFITFGRGVNNPEVQAQIDLSLAPTDSMVERFGLFTIIVLGEVIVGVVQGVAGLPVLTLEVGIIGGAGMLVAVGLWWLYFDFVSHRHPSYRAVMIWLYAHLPLTAGIALSGAAVLNAIERAGEPLPPEVRWLLVGSVALALFGIALLIRTLHDAEADPGSYRSGMVAMMIVGIAVLALGFSTVQPILLLGSLAFLLLVPIFFGFVSWIQADSPSAHSTAD